MNLCSDVLNYIVIISMTSENLEKITYVHLNWDRFKLF